MKLLKKRCYQQIGCLFLNFRVLIHNWLIKGQLNVYSPGAWNSAIAMDMLIFTKRKNQFIVSKRYYKSPYRTC